MSNIDKTCTTHHVCDCIQERLDRIEAVYQKYKHLDHNLADDALLLGKDDDGSDNLMRYILYDLWQAIRREMK